MESVRLSKFNSHSNFSYNNIIYSDTKRSLSDYIGEESQKFLRSNSAHLLALTVDSIIGLNGGLKQLLALSTNLKLSSKVLYSTLAY